MPTASIPPRQMLLNGATRPTPERIRLRAGVFQIEFDPENAMLRYICLGDQELLRAINAPIRDHNWGTISPQVHSIQLKRGVDWFSLTFQVDCQKGDIDFRWAGRITGNADGQVVFAFDGKAHSSFKRNRIGFCILHPMDCAGKRCKVYTVDGDVLESSFPVDISPHQPFFNMMGIAHEVSPGLWIEVRFDGEIFEMEDQRNWTDASYKTYCTPLERPFPVRVEAGDEVQQRVKFSLRGGGLETPIFTDIRRMGDGLIDLFPFEGKPLTRLPTIGLGAVSHGSKLSQREIARIKAMAPDHLRMDLNLFDSSFPTKLEQACTEALTLNTKLELVLYLSDDGEQELAHLIQEIQRIRPPAARWLIFHRDELSTSERWTSIAQTMLAGTNAPIGAGSHAYFTELNRKRPSTAPLDFVCYSINPQVHAFDDASLVETLPAQAATVASARKFTDNLPIVVSPVTLKPRSNPNATAPAGESLPGILPDSVDPRQLSLFGACWTLGSLKHLAEGGVSSVTFYETTGWRGVMETEEGSPIPPAFPSVPGSVFPLYHVLADVMEYRGGDVVVLRSTEPLMVEGLAIEREGKVRIMVANYSSHSNQVRLKYQGLKEWIRVKRLDEESAEQAMMNPKMYRQDPGLLQEIHGGVLTLGLLPYSVVRIDGQV